MVQIIAGKKGKGKTKYLLDMANNAVKESKGSIVYLDKSSKHMYELSNKIRLINVPEFPVHSAEAFVGFSCGIISQDHDLEVMYLSLIHIFGSCVPEGRKGAAPGLGAHDDSYQKWADLFGTHKKELFKCT